MLWMKQHLAEVILVALALGGAGGWWVHGVTAAADEHWATPRVVEGWAYQAGTSGGIGCCGSTEEKAGGHGYDVHNVTWRDVRGGTIGPWHSNDRGSPGCLPANEPALVRFGVIDIAPTDDAPGHQAVAWLECR